MTDEDKIEVVREIFTLMTGEFPSVSFRDLCAESNGNAVYAWRPGKAWLDSELLAKTPLRVGDSVFDAFVATILAARVKLQSERDAKDAPRLREERDKFKDALEKIVAEHTRIGTPGVSCWCAFQIATKALKETP